MRRVLTGVLIATATGLPAAVAQSGIKFRWTTHTQMIVRAGNNQETAPPNIPMPYQFSIIAEDGGALAIFDTTYRSSLPGAFTLRHFANASTTLDASSGPHETLITVLPPQSTMLWLEVYAKRLTPYVQTNVVQLDIGNDKTIEFDLAGKYEARARFRLNVPQSGLPIRTRSGITTPTKWPWTVYGVRLELGFMTTPGGIEIYGIGCAKQGSFPLLHDADALYAVPYAGAATTVSWQHGPPSGFGLLMVGTSRNSWMGLTLPFDLTPLGAPGCRIYAGMNLPLQIRFARDGNGQIGLYLGKDPGLIGRSVYTQVIAFDQGANNLGLLTSNGIKTTFAGF